MYNMLYSQGLSDEEQSFIHNKNKLKQRECQNCAFVTVLLVIFISIVVILVILYWPYDDEKSRFGYYKSAAIATDSPLCSTIGKDILFKNGSAVDAAIASMLCIGLYHAQSSGLGGGFFMIVYDSPKSGGPKEMLTFDARETAPAAASQQIYIDGASYFVGGKSIGIPGEVKGYHEAWSKFGKLPWKDLFEPVLKMCQEGFRVGKPLAKFIRQNEAMIKNTSSLAQIFLKPNGDIYKEGDAMYRTDLIPTFNRIANDPLTFYKGELAKDIVLDIKEFDGLITLEDLANYEVVVKPAFMLHLNNLNLSLYTLPPPSAGPIFAFMLALLDEFDLRSKTDVISYQKIVETFKFGYALKTYLGDEDFENLTIIMKNLTSQDFLHYIKSRVDLTHTHEIPYYMPQSENVKDAGTSHLSLIAPNGGVVSATTTINEVFGSQRRGKRTGIIFNDEMADFTFKKNIGNENFVKPGKRPQSSMCPAILLNGVMGSFRLAIGGAGGSEITSATTFVSASNLWLGMKIEDAVSTPRLHHQLFPNTLTYQKNFPHNLVKELEGLGHEVKEALPKDLISIVQVVERVCDDSNKKCLVAVSDGRKYGAPDGF